MNPYPYGPPSPFGPYPSGVPPFGPSSYGPPSPFGPPSFGPYPSGVPPFGPLSFAPPLSSYGPIGIGQWRVVNKTFLPVEISHSTGPPFRIFPRQVQTLVLPGEDRMILRIYSLGNLISLEVSGGSLKASSGGEVSRSSCGKWLAYFPMASLRVTMDLSGRGSGPSGPCQTILIEADQRGSTKKKHSRRRSFK